MAEKYELAEKDYMNGMKYKDIAEKHGVTINTVKSWKQRHKWSKDKKSVHTKTKGVHTKSDAENNQQQGKRSGNPNPSHKFPKHNRASWLHGLTSKFLHAEQVEIIEAFGDCSVADKIWIQLEIKFSAIIRMQQIMWVDNAHSHLDEISLRADGEGGATTGYKVVYAHERYESYIKAQARAMAEYRNLVDSFLKHAGEDDERRLKLEQMQLSIDKTKAEIKNLSDDGAGESKTIIVTGEDEMRRVLDERNKRTQSD